jgi:prophage antirepressor-like protein
VVADVALDVGRAFSYGNLPVRLKVDAEGEILFRADDVCEALELGNPRDAVARHVDPEDVGKHDTLTAGGVQQVNYVNLSGLYALVFGSQKEAARKFKRWVTHEVLPSIQRTGSYSLGGVAREPDAITARPTAAQKLANLASAAALNTSLERNPDALQEQIQARHAAAKVSVAEKNLRAMNLTVDFERGLEQPIVRATYPEPLQAWMQTKEGRTVSGQVLIGRAYILQMTANLERPTMRPLQVGEHLLKPTVEGVKFLANQARFGLDEWREIAEWARRKVQAEQNRK